MYEAQRMFQVSILNERIYHRTHVDYKKANKGTKKLYEHNLKVAIREETKLY